MENINQVNFIKSDFCISDPPIFIYPFSTKELYSEEYLKWMNDPDITKTLGRFDYLMPVTQKKLIDYYQSIDPSNTMFLAIYYSENKDLSNTNEKQFIGTLKIYDIELLARRVSIGIIIGDKSNWGKKFASTAIGISCRYIFDVLGFRKISAGYIAGNIGMEKAFLNNGFHIEARFIEHLFFQGNFVDHIFVCKFRR
jgi:RimJ/RimL family protein N-acetyltransferase